MLSDVHVCKNVTGEIHLPRPPTHTSQPFGKKQKLSSLFDWFHLKDLMYASEISASLYCIDHIVGLLPFVSAAYFGKFFFEFGI